jgi:hypothetical protein
MRGGRRHSIPACFGRSVKESFLLALAMPERRTEHVACRKTRVGCKCLGGIEWHGGS